MIFTRLEPWREIIAQSSKGKSKRIIVEGSERVESANESSFICSTMNPAGGKNSAVSAAAAEAEVVDLCIDSDTDDETRAMSSYRSSSSSAASSRKRQSARNANGNKRGGDKSSGAKKKRPKPDPSGFDQKPAIASSSNDSSDDDIEIIEIDCSPATARFTSKSSTEARPSSHSSGNDDEDSDVELVDGSPSWQSWTAAKDTSSASRSSAQRGDNADGGETISTTRRGHLKDDRAYETSDTSMTSATSNTDVSDDNDDEDFEIVATKGQNALVDFPHSRENCVTHPFARPNATNDDKKKHCANCYCYVCDIPANDCKSWELHCMASHDDRHWRQERDRVKRLGIEAAATAAPATAAAAAPPAASASAARSATATVTTSSLSSSSSWSRRSFTIVDRYSNRPDLPQYSITALLEKLIIVHPVEATPPRTKFATNLRHYQKQSLAFMLEVERSTDLSPFLEKLDGIPQRGGFLCDEVGMGKSSVVLALVASNPLPSALMPTLNQVKAHVRLARRRGQQYKHNSRVLPSRRIELTPITRMKIKATVIMTSASLLGQWEDECRKHAPNLVVKVCHSTRSAKKDPTAFHYLDTKDIQNIDVIISTATFDWDKKYPTFTDTFEFHRVVMDESHLFGKGNSACSHYAKKIKSTRRWCVTATPCTGSSSELQQQLSFLGGLASVRYRIPDLNNTKANFYWIFDILKAIMIRHTKAQRINGLEALALPPSSTTTTLVGMSALEKATMKENLKKHLLVRYKESGGEKAFTISRALGLLSGFGCNSKLTMLLRDLQALRLKEPSLRAVVFTQSRDTHEKVIAAVKRDRFDVFQFSGSTGPKQRDASIRGFQAKSPRPAVFVITMRAGNVGITLTAASRVYLMEPCLDPALEVQAAGRIHRLGQTKAVQVIRYAFKKSPEENIVRLHEDIVAGKVSITDGHVPVKAIKILSSGL